MKQGDSIQITAKVLRVSGERVDAQTPNGELIQTHVSNVVELNSPVVVKAVLTAPESKTRKK